MRTLALSLVLLLVGAAAAQSSTDHGVSVDVPVVLKLRLDGATTIGGARQPIVTEVAGGGATVTPTDGLQILSNVPWQLGVAYLPASAADVRLRLLGAGGGTPLSPIDRIIAHGDRTGGWIDLPIAIDLDGAPPADGRYRGTLVYTLSQP
jgi:hypothetical protein